MPINVSRSVARGARVRRDATALAHEHAHNIHNNIYEKGDGERGIVAAAAQNEIRQKEEQKTTCVYQAQHSARSLAGHVCVWCDARVFVCE